MLRWVPSSRSSRPDVFCKKGVLRTFAKFTRKYLYQSLFNKVFLKKRLWHRRFTVSFVNFLRIPFFTEHLQWLFLWFILVASIIVIWVGWFSGHKFKLDTENFYLSYSPEKFCKFRRENTCSVFNKKSAEFLLFFILFSACIYLFKAWSCSKW